MQIDMNRQPSVIQRSQFVDCIIWTKLELTHIKFPCVFRMILNFRYRITRVTRLQLVTISIKLEHIKSLCRETR